MTNPRTQTSWRADLWWYVAQGSADTRLIVLTLLFAVAFVGASAYNARRG